MKYIFAIDETGSFHLNCNNSFSCGVVITDNELSLKQTYQKLYKEMGFPNPIPNDTHSILTNTETEDGRFHFAGMSLSQKKLCYDLLMPYANKVYVSEGKPALFANNQNWWLIATTVVIKEFLCTHPFNQNDEVEIWIDCRKNYVWGIIDQSYEHKDYHDLLKAQIEQHIKKIAASKKIKYQIKFLSDTYSFYINLADIICGFVRKNKDYPVTCDIIKCSCRKYGTDASPYDYTNSNPIFAFNLILQEAAENKLDNINITAEILKNLRKDENEYQLAWDLFYDFMKFRIKERSIGANLVALRPLAQIFIEEVNKDIDSINSTNRLEMMVLLTEYCSHAGDTISPFKYEYFEKVLQDKSKKAEKRQLRKWEKLVSYTLRDAQINFNNYDFSTAREKLENLWDTQKKLIEILKSRDEDLKDEPTAALIGSLAQSYAYSDDHENAILYCEESGNYAISTNDRTASYLFSIYHRERDISKTQEFFKKQTGKTAEEYAKSKDFTHSWYLLSYCRLRALELYVNGETNLPAIDIYDTEQYKSDNKEYPLPLVLKWEGIARYLEDKTDTLAKEYFREAINILFKEETGFAIKSLAIPIIQCYSYIDNQNEFHARYNGILAKMTKESEGFQNYIDEKAALLKDIKNNEDIWQRAMSLPFIYA